MFDILHKKKIYFDKRAFKEYRKLPKSVQKAFDELISELSQEGKLVFPSGRKINGTGLFEMRVKVDIGIWRSMYYYQNGDIILVLNFFGKKSQKTPRKYINNALSRLNEYK